MFNFYFLCVRILDALEELLKLLLKALKKLLNSIHADASTTRLRKYT